MMATRFHATPLTDVESALETFWPRPTGRAGTQTRQGPAEPLAPFPGGFLRFFACGLPWAGYADAAGFACGLVDGWANPCIGGEKRAESLTLARCHRGGPGCLPGPGG